MELESSQGEMEFVRQFCPESIPVAIKTKKDEVIEYYEKRNEHGDLNNSVKIKTLQKKPRNIIVPWKKRILRINLQDLRTFKGVGGLPLGTQGSMVVLMSGGLDSPVAAWLMMRRGVTIIPVYCNNSPYAENAARERAFDCIRQLQKWAPPARFHCMSWKSPRVQGAAELGCAGLGCFAGGQAVRHANIH